MKRVVWCFKKVGIDAIPFPAGFEIWEGKKYHWSSDLPSDHRKFTIALRNFFGQAVYKLTVTVQGVQLVI